MPFDFSKFEFETYALSFASALAILIFGWLIAIGVGRFVHDLGTRSARLSPTLVPLFAKLSRLTITVMAILAALERIGVRTTSFLAVLGAAGLAIGLALKDTVSDIASGVVLLILRPFNVGDAVDIGGTGGVVEAIDIFETRLKSFEGVPIVLGNSMVRTSKISNYSRASKRRIDLLIGISYKDDIGKAVKRIEQILRAEPRVLSDSDIVINVDSLADSAVTLLVRCWSLPADFLTTKMDLTRTIKEGLDAEGICIPFPQRDVHLIRSDAA